MPVSHPSTSQSTASAILRFVVDRLWGVGIGAFHAAPYIVGVFWALGQSTWGMYGEAIAQVFGVLALITTVSGAIHGPRTHNGPWQPTAMGSLWLPFGIGIPLFVVAPGFIVFLFIFAVVLVPAFAATFASGWFAWKIMSRNTVPQPMGSTEDRLRAQVASGVVWALVATTVVFMIQSSFHPLEFFYRMATPIAWATMGVLVAVMVVVAFRFPVWTPRATLYATLTAAVVTPALLVLATWAGLWGYTYRGQGFSIGFMMENPQTYTTWSASMAMVAVFGAWNTRRRLHIWHEVPHPNGFVRWVWQPRWIVPLAGTAMAVLPYALWGSLFHPAMAEKAAILACVCFATLLPFLRSPAVPIALLFGAAVFFHLHERHTLFIASLHLFVAVAFWIGVAPAFSSGFHQRRQDGAFTVVHKRPICFERNH